MAHTLDYTMLIIVTQTKEHDRQMFMIIFGKKIKLSLYKYIFIDVKLLGVHKNNRRN